MAYRSGDTIQYAQLIFMFSNHVTYKYNQALSNMLGRVRGRGRREEGGGKREEGGGRMEEGGGMGRGREEDKKRDEEGGGRREEGEGEGKSLQCL